MNRIRHSVSRILWGLMGLFFLNISVDTADFNPEYFSEDLTINDQESIIEIVVEGILGYEDAIKEHEDHDRAEHNCKVNFKIDLFNRVFRESHDVPRIAENTKQMIPHISAHISEGFDKRFSPPPEH